MFHKKNTVVITFALIIESPQHTPVQSLSIRHTPNFT